MKHQTPTLAKFKRLSAILARQLGTPADIDPDTITVGVLERLWHCTIRDAKEGDIGKLTNLEIAEACGWYLDPDDFISALVDTRWLDVHQADRLRVHNWSEHMPRFLKGTLAAQQKRKTKVNHNGAPQRSTTGDDHKDPTTKPNLTKPNRKTLQGSSFGLGGASASAPLKGAGPVTTDANTKRELMRAKILKQLRADGKPEPTDQQLEDMIDFALASQ